MKPPIYALVIDEKDVQDMVKSTASPPFAPG